MYPHNFNLVFRWSERTSALMRDWLLLQIRRGVASDDQKTLYFAEQRQMATGGLAVGQVATPFAAALYNAVRMQTKNATDKLRLSRVLRGPVHLVHSKSGPSACAAFNKHAYRERQLFAIAHKPTGAKRSNISTRTLFSLEECELSLAGYGVAAGLVSFQGGSGDSEKATRIMCKFRDVGPRVTPSLHAELLSLARGRNASDEALHDLRSTLDKYLEPRASWIPFDSYNPTHELLIIRDPVLARKYPSWPPVFRPPLEAMNATRFFGRVEIE